jgi:hypothetical protein
VTTTTSPPIVLLSLNQINHSSAKTVQTLVLFRAHQRYRPWAAVAFLSLLSCSPCFPGVSPTSELSAVLLPDSSSLITV